MLVDQVLKILSNILNISSFCSFLQISFSCYLLAYCRSQSVSHGNSYLGDCLLVTIMLGGLFLLLRGLLPLCQDSHLLLLFYLYFIQHSSIFCGVRELFSVFFALVEPFIYVLDIHDGLILFTTLMEDSSMFTYVLSKRIRLISFALFAIYVCTDSLKVTFLLNQCSSRTIY